MSEEKMIREKKEKWCGTNAAVGQGEDSVGQGKYACNMLHST